MVLPDGSAAFEDREEEHITIINEQLRAHHIPLSVEAITVQSPEDIVSQLEMGNMLILTADIDGGHAILMDKVFTDNYGSESIMSYWDPAVPIAELSQQFMPTTRTFFLLYNGVEHFPVTVGSNIKVIRRISDDTSQN